jgi:hypothetical protein
MAVTDHTEQPIPGLPEQLPNGEHVLWQGSPSWWGIAARALHLRAVAIYLALIVLWGTTSAIANHKPTIDVSLFAVKLLAISACALGGLVLFSVLVSRTTVYTITNRRIVMRIGVALPVTMNIPFNTIQSADVRLFADGSGDIPLQLESARRQPFLVLWPHVRPWHTAKPQPMLRAIAKAKDVAAILTSALSAPATVKPAVLVRMPRTVISKPSKHSPGEKTVAA